MEIKNPTSFRHQYKANHFSPTHQKAKSWNQVTPFPNHLLDQVMPVLKDTEWRVLCVIVRQTNGWINPLTGRRKRSDWLTHRQLLRRTGRASAAICEAIQNLIIKELIEVHTETGHLLATAHDRRRSGNRLYYRLHPDVRKANDSAVDRNQC